MISNVAFLCVCAAAASCTRFAIDVNDILSEELMPSNLLMLENPTEDGNVTTTVKDLDGTLDDAVKTMGFHRNMMNQYMCRSYLAEQIVSEMSAFRVRRRMGQHAPNEARLTPTKFQINIKDNLMYDEGSSAYKDWLTKSTTLEDIYRHYNQEADNKVDVEESTDEEDGKNEDFDAEVVPHVPSHKTGMPHSSMKHRGEEVYYASDGGYPYPYQQGSGHGGGYGSSAHGGGGASYAVHEPSVEHVYEDTPHEQEHIYHTYHNPPKYHGDSHGKDKDLTELFEVALTALAYLSFGLFIVHVIMCISSVTNQSTTTPNAMPMSMSPSATGAGMTGTGGGDTGTGGGGDNGTGGGEDNGTGGGDDGTGGEDGGDDGTGGEDGGDDSNGDGGDDGTGGGNGGDVGTGGGDGGDVGTGDGGGDDGTGGGDGEDVGTGDGGGGDDGTGGGDGGDAGTGDGGGGDDGTGGGDGGDGGTGTGDGGVGDGDTGTGNGGGAGDDGTGVGGGDTATGGGDTTGGASPGTGTGTAADDVRDTIDFKMKRDIPTIANPDTKVLNELARRILTSIDAAVMANEDDGECLRKSLCENNKWSKGLSGRNKLIVPIWSVGMSWLSGRLVKSIPSPTTMLDSLKSTMLGLGDANCEMIYRNCDYRTRKAEGKRSRRRKRNSSKRK